MPAGMASIIKKKIAVKAAVVNGRDFISFKNWFCQVEDLLIITGGGGVGRKIGGGGGGKGKKYGLVDISTDEGRVVRAVLSTSWMCGEGSSDAAGGSILQNWCLWWLNCTKVVFTGVNHSSATTPTLDQGKSS